MKNLILFLLLAVTAAAQNPSTNLPATYLPTALVYTNAYGDDMTNTTASGTLNATRSETIGWEIRYQLTGAGTGTNFYDFEVCLTTTNWPGAYFQTVALAANGTNYVQTNFTMNVEAQGYVRLARTRHGSNSGATTTNQTLYYTPKPFVRR